MSEVKAKPERKARVSALYDFDYQKGAIKLRNRKCPRCGNVMALHKAPVARWTCGSCSYTDYIKGQTKP